MQTTPIVPDDPEHPCDGCEGSTPESELQFVADEWLCEECRRRAEAEAAGEEWKNGTDLNDEEDV